MARPNPFADLLPQRPARTNPFDDLRPRYARDEQSVRNRLSRIAETTGRQFAIPENARLSALDPLGLLTPDDDRPAPPRDGGLPAIVPTTGMTQDTQRPRMAGALSNEALDFDAAPSEKDEWFARRVAGVFGQEPLQGVGYKPNAEEDFYYMRYGTEQVSAALERVNQAMPGFAESVAKMPRPSQRLAAARKALYPDLSAQDFARALNLQTRAEANTGPAFIDPEPQPMPLPASFIEGVRAGAAMGYAGGRTIYADLTDDQEMLAEAADATKGAGAAIEEAKFGKGYWGTALVDAGVSLPMLAGGGAAGRLAKAGASVVQARRFTRTAQALEAAKKAGDTAAVQKLTERMASMVTGSWPEKAAKVGQIGAVGLGSGVMEYGGQRADGEDIATSATVAGVNAVLEMAFEGPSASAMLDRLVDETNVGRRLAQRTLLPAVAEGVTEVPTGFAQSVSENVIKGEEIDWKRAGEQGVAGFGAGFISGGVMGGAGETLNIAAEEVAARRRAPESVNDLEALRELRRRAGIETPAPAATPAPEPPPAAEPPAAGKVRAGAQTTTVEGQRPAEPPEAQPAPDAAEALREQVAVPPEPAAPPVRPRRGRQQAPEAAAPAATPPVAESAPAPAGAVPLPAFDPQVVRGVDDDDTEARQIAAVQARSDFARAITARRAAGPLTPETVREAQAQVAEEWGVNPDILADDTTIAVLTQPTEAPDVSVAGRVTDVAEPQPADGGGVGVPAGGPAAPGGAAAGLGGAGVADAGPVSPVQPAGVAPDDGAAPVADAGSLDQPAVAPATPPARPRRGPAATSEPAATPSDDALRQSRAALAAQLERGDVPPERAERLRTLIAEIDADLAGPKFSRRAPADDGGGGGGGRPPPRRVGINETAAWLDVAGRDDAVQQPLRGDTDLGALLQVADPALRAKPAGTAETEIGEAEVFSIQNDTGRGAIRVYATGDKVYMDASDSGGFGTKAYQAVANWALNTDRTFVGDPAGLSDAGVIRFTEQMVSAALKAGTTQHLEPHPRQKVRDRGWMSALPWTKGDDLGNIAGLLQTSAEQVAAFAPAVKGMDYDPATGRFSQGGRPVTDAQFAKIAANASAAFRNRPGRQVDATTGEIEVDTSNVFGPATIKRAALTFAMLRNPNAAMAGGSPQGSQIARILYSKRAAPQAQVSVAMDNRDVRVSVEGPKGDRVSVAAGPLIDRLTKRANMVATLLDCVRK